MDDMPTTRSPDAQPFGVLMVCRANVCRSPMAAALLLDRVAAADLPWAVTSAGTHARPDLDVAPLVGAVLGEQRLRPITLQSRPVTAALVAEADLVLTADTRTRQDLVSRHVSALRRTFTLLQFARLCSVIEIDSVVPDELGPSLLLGAGLARQRVQPAARGADDIADPFGQDITHFRTTRDTIAGALDRIMRPVTAASVGASVGASDDAPEDLRAGTPDR